MLFGKPVCYSDCCWSRISASVISEQPAMSAPRPRIPQEQKLASDVSAVPKATLAAIGRYLTSSLKSIQGSYVAGRLTKLRQWAEAATWREICQVSFFLAADGRSGRRLGV
jgi:hypothetical protein